MTRLLGRRDKAVEFGLVGARIDAQRTCARDLRIRARPTQQCVYTPLYTRSVSGDGRSLESGLYERQQPGRAHPR